MSKDNKNNKNGGRAILSVTLVALSMLILWHRAYKYQVAELAANGSGVGQGPVVPVNFRMVSVGGLQSSIAISGQPGLMGLAAFLDSMHFDMVIRLDMEQSATDILSIDNERETVETDCRMFVTANIDNYSINDDRRMQQMRDLVDMINETNSLSDCSTSPHDLRVLIHCLHGVHRAATVAACWLRSRGFTFEQACEAVGWGELIKSPGKYRKYVNTVYNFTTA